MAQENTHDQKMAELAKHKDAHIAYWKGQNKQTDPKRFEDGFIQGWCDAENKDYPNINRDSMISQRKNENIAHCGDSPYEWAFGDGYHEGFDARRCLNTSAPKPAPPAQEDTHEQKMAEMCKHKDAHIAYWKAHGNRPTDPQRFEDGFIQGWCDCEHNLSDCNVTVNSLIGQRHQEHVKSHGDSPCEWAFDDGYREGFEARKCMTAKPAPVENTHEQKMAEMGKHKDAHVAYWKAHGNRPTDPQRFEDGFIQGWCDCEHHLSDQTITVNSLIGQRHQEHVKSHGDSPCEWAFDDGYREGFEGRKCMKPPQQSAPPPVVKTAPPKPSDCPPTEAPKPPQTAPPVAPPTTYPNPAPPTQPPAPTQPPVSDCPPTQAPQQPPVAPPVVPPTTYPVQPPPPTQPPAPPKPADCPPPPVNTLPPTAPPVTPAPPTKPVDCPPPTTSAPPTSTPVAPPTTGAPGPDHQCTPACNHPPPTASAPPTNTPVPPPTTNAPGPDHQCTPACNHPPATATQPTVPPPTEHHCTSECATNGCNHSKDGPPSTNNPTTAPSKPTTTDDHCNTDAADLPADHQCTSECNHATKKEGLLHKIEHALNLDD